MAPIPIEEEWFEPPLALRSTSRTFPSPLHSRDNNNPQPFDCTKEKRGSCISPRRDSNPRILPHPSKYSASIYPQDHGALAYVIKFAIHNCNFFVSLPDFTSVRLHRQQGCSSQSKCPAASTKKIKVLIQNETGARTVMLTKTKKMVFYIFFIEIGSKLLQWASEYWIAENRK